MHGPHVLLGPTLQPACMTLAARHGMAWGRWNTQAGAFQEPLLCFQLLPPPHGECAQTCVCFTIESIVESCCSIAMPQRTFRLLTSCCLTAAILSLQTQCCTQCQLHHLEPKVNALMSDNTHTADVRTCAPIHNSNNVGAAPPPTCVTDACGKPIRPHHVKLRRRGGCWLQGEAGDIMRGVDAKTEQ